MLWINTALSMPTHLGITEPTQKKGKAGLQTNITPP